MRHRCRERRESRVEGAERGQGVGRRAAGTAGARRVSGPPPHVLTVGANRALKPGHCLVVLGSHLKVALRILAHRADLGC